MRKTWKLIALAALGALGVLALLPGAGAPVAYATPSGPPVVSSITVGVGGSVTVTSTYLDDTGGAGNAVLTAAYGSGAAGDFTACVLTANSDGQTVTCSGLDTVTVTDDALAVAEPTTISATWVCTVPGTISFSLTDPGGTSGATAIICTTSTNTPTSTSTATPTTTPSTPTPTATPSVGPPSTVTVSVAPTSVGCQGSAFVTATVKDANGNYVADGTVVTLSSTIGTINPSAPTTSSGGVLGVLTAPAVGSGGQATVTATAGSASGTATIQVGACGATPAPTTAAPAPVATAVIRPPSTGDAGLAAGLSEWRGYAGIALIAASLLGAVAVVRQRA